MHNDVLRRFEDWIESNFDMTNAKIKEKHEHTHAVLNTAAFIAKESNLSLEDLSLAQIIAILHDCARFPQIVMYDSFQDTENFNHSIEGAKMLRDGLLAQMLPETREFDSIIITAVELHGALSLPEDLDARTLMHCNIIRDADRTDLYNMCIEKFEILFWAKVSLSPKVKELFEQRKPIPFPEIKNDLDLLALRFGLINQYKSQSALGYIKEQDYINRLTDLFLKERPQYNKTEVEWVRNTALSFIE